MKFKLKRVCVFEPHMPMLIAQNMLDGAIVELRRMSEDMSALVDAELRQNLEERFPGYTFEEICGSGKNQAIIESVRQGLIDEFTSHFTFFNSFAIINRRMPNR